MKNSDMVSPSIVMDISSRIQKVLWDKHKTYKKVKIYITRWHETFSNFEIITKSDSENIDLEETLGTMEDELLFKIAIDLNIEVPGLIYSVAEIKGILSQRYKDIGQRFEESCKEIYSDPSSAIIKANSALERIVKKICSDDRIDSCKSKDTLYKLTSHLLKQFKFFPDKSLTKDIRNIGSGLLNVSQAIENIRSNNTVAHGTEQEIISDPIYAMLVVNTVATIGLLKPLHNSIQEVVIR